MWSVQRFLERKRKLQVNREKSQVLKTDQAQFIGFFFKELGFAGLKTLSVNSKDG
jgi:hypothetical protein